MDPLLRQAIARIDIVRDGQSVAHGTGCLVTSDLVLTAMHVVANRSASGPAFIPGTISLTFPSHTCEATLVDGRWDARSDWALVRCATPPGAVGPVPLAESAADHDAWETFGFPEANPRDGLAHVGTVSHAAGTFDGVAAYQLFSDQAAAGAGSPVKGLSGSPVLVDGALAGVIRSSLMRDGGTNVAGTLYACPIAAVLDRCADLLPVPDPCRGLPGLPRIALPSPPYRFLERFTALDAEIFFGRNREIRKLYDLVTTGSAPIVLLYGQSGSGKSSFLDAGLLPRLASTHTTVYVRRERERGLLQTAIDALRSPTSANPGGATDLGATWRAIETAAGKPLVLIVDQVEEAFTLRGADGEVGTFIETIASMQSGASPRGRLVLSFRKEWLGEIQKVLDAHRLDYSKVFLETLDRYAVAEVVGGLATTNRLRDKYGLTVEAELPAAMAAELTADRDSPVAPTLQVLLSRMWLEAAKASAGSPCFTAELYARITRAGVLLTDFLDQQLAALATSAKAAGGSVADVVESGLALDVLRFHVSRLGTAEERSEQALIDEYHRDDDVAWLVGELKRLYLLTEPAGDGAETGATRLAHDTLGPAIRTRCDESLLPGQRARRVLEGRASEWSDGREGTPLDARDLMRVEQGATGMRAWRPDEQRLIDASRKLRDNDVARRRMLRYTTMAAALLVLIAGGAAWLFWARTVADKAWSDLIAFADSIPTVLDMRPALGLVVAIDGVDRGLALTKGVVPVTLQESLALALDSARERQAWTLPAAAATATAMAPDGRIAVAMADNTIRVYRLGEAEAIAVIKAHGPAVDLSFSEDGELLAAASPEGGLAVWQRSGERVAGVPVELADSAFSVRFVPGGRTLVALQLADTHLRLCLFDLDAKQLDCVVVPGFNTRTPPPLAVERLDANRAVVATVTEERVFLNVTEGAKWSPKGDYLRREQGETMFPGLKGLAMAMDDTGLWVAAAAPGRVTVVDALDNPRSTVAIEPNTNFTRVAFGAGGRTIIASSDDGVVRVYDRTGRALLSPLTVASDVAGLAVSADGQLVAVAGNGAGTARLSINDMVGFGVPVPPPLARPRPAGGIQQPFIEPWTRAALSFLPNGQMVVVGADETNGVWQWDLLRGEASPTIRKVAGFSAGLGGALAGDRAGRFFALSQAGVEQFGVDQPRRVVLTGDYASLTMSPDAKTLFAGSRYGWVSAVEPSTGQVIGRTGPVGKRLPADVLAIAFHPSGEPIAAAFRGGAIGMFRRDGSEIAGDFASASGHATAVMFHPDGYLITGSDRGEVRRQPTENGLRQEWAIRAFTGGSVTGLALHPSGSPLFVAGTQGMRAIDLDSGSLLNLPTLNSEPFRGIAISPDGRLLAGARANGGFKFWRVGWREWLAEGCERLKGHELFTMLGKPGMTVDSIPGLGGIEPYNAFDACGRLVWNVK